MEHKKLLDFSKPIKTRSGYEVRILAGNLKGPQGKCIASAIKNGDGNEFLFTHDKYGAFQADGRPDSYDLVNVVPKRKVWFNVYPERFYRPSAREENSHFAYGYATKELAEKAAGKDRLACIELEIPDTWED